MHDERSDPRVGRHLQNALGAGTALRCPYLSLCGGLGLRTMAIRMAGARELTQ